MKIIISPAKKMNVDTDTYQVTGLPVFLEDTKLLMDEIKSLTFAQAKELWKCNDRLAQLNYDRFRSMDVERCLTPAVLTYEGLQYQHMAPEIFTEGALAYIDRHLRILSGFYGVLKPFDGVTPYRLEMQARLSVKGKKDLYDFWGDNLYWEVIDDSRIIINLASKEYSKCIEKYLTPDDRYITISFCEQSGGRLITKGTYAKMARGEMVRYMAENHIENPDDIKEFDHLGYVFRDDISSDREYIFERKTVK